MTTKRHKIYQIHSFSLSSIACLKSTFDKKFICFYSSLAFENQFLLFIHERFKFFTLFSEVCRKILYLVLHNNKLSNFTRNSSLNYTANYMMNREAGPMQFAFPIEVCVRTMKKAFQGAMSRYVTLFLAFLPCTIFTSSKLKHVNEIL